MPSRRYFAIRWATTSVSVCVSKTAAFGDQLVSQLGEVLDDAVVDDGDPFDKVRMRVGLVGHAMGRPARVRNADRSRQRFSVEALFEIEELALGATAIHVAVMDGGDAGRIIAAVLSRFSASTRRPATGLFPTIPTIPHMQSPQSLPFRRPLVTILVFFLNRPRRSLSVSARYAETAQRLGLLCSLDGKRALAQDGGSARLHFLARTAESERIGGYIRGDDTAGGDIGVVANADRRNERRVRADEGVLAPISVSCLLTPS